MLLIVEAIMFISGIWALVTGTIPSFLFGGPQYKLEGRGVRLIGIVLMIPLPFAFVMGMGLGILLKEDVSGYAFFFELILVLGIGILAMIVSRLIRTPATELENGLVESDVEIEGLIGKKSQGSLIYVLLGGLGFPAIILCPLAFIRSSQALRMIDEYGIGEQYRKMATAARILSVVVSLFWAGVLMCLIVPILIGF